MCACLLCFHTPVCFSNRTIRFCARPFCICARLICFILLQYAFVLVLFVSFMLQFVFLIVPFLLELAGFVFLHTICFCDRPIFIYSPCKCLKVFVLVWFVMWSSSIYLYSCNFFYSFHFSDLHFFLFMHVLYLVAFHLYPSFYICIRLFYICARPFNICIRLFCICARPFKICTRLFCICARPFKICIRPSYTRAHPVCLFYSTICNCDCLICISSCPICNYYLSYHPSCIHNYQSYLCMFLCSSQFCLCSSQIICDVLACKLSVIFCMHNLQQLSINQNAKK